MRPRGGIIGASVTPTQQVASGVWTLREAEAYGRDFLWPRAFKAGDVLISDQFTAANGTAISGRTPSPTSLGSNVWSTATWSGDNSVAACQIQNNQAQQLTFPGETQNNYSWAYINGQAADVTVSGTLSLGSRDGPYSYCGLAARVTPSASVPSISGIALLLFSNNLGSVDVGASLILRSWNNGAYVNLGTRTAAVAYNTAYTATLTVSGSSITAVCNGVTITATSTVNQTVGSHGFFIGHTEDKGSGTQSYVDNLVITQA